MTFDEVLAQVKTLLQQEQRVSYRGLKRRFALDDEYLEDLKEELIGAKHLAIDEDGRFLVWVGNSSLASRVQSLGSEKIQGSRSTVQSQEIQSPTPSPQPLAERRQLTVMFIDLVGSTTLSQQLDPEDYHACVVAYQAACHHVIARYEGHIARYLGDGVPVYFGYPAAHEDDAVRAVRSGLEIVAAVNQLRGAPPLHIRIGLHTGLVVVAEIGTGVRTEQLALGETPNIAARIQGHANPDEVVISAATYRLVEGLFEAEDRGQPDLKGIATPLALYRVINESEVHSRFEVVVRKGLTPLIGREHEFGLLRERWERVKDGAGQVVLLGGEPGIGKSRLVEALKATVGPEGARFLELRCSPYSQNSALQPVIEYLQRTLQFRPEDSAIEKLRKLAQAVEQRSRIPSQSERSVEDVIASAAKRSLPPKEIASSLPAPRNDTTRLQEEVPLFAALLSLPHPEGYPPITLSPQKQKEKTHEALVSWLCAEAQQQAVTYAWEDLHWADPSTLELLTLFLAQVPTTRLLAVLTFRPEFTPPWGTHSYFSQINLSRLGRSHVEAMVEKVTNGKTLPKEIVQQIVSKTDGVPLFVEELTKSVVESVGAYGRASLQALEIPSTLQDSLMARLDRLGTAKEIAQLGATLGREFTYELLRAVSPLHEDALQQSLQQLVDSELVFQSGMPPQARYLFKHALVQDIAYQSLLKSRRQQLHQQVAEILQERFPQTVETQPELIAHHYTEAGLAAQAIPYWQQAGQKAVARSANVEAISHLSKGLELLKTLPNTPERSRQELTLQMALGPPFQYTKGYGAPEVEQTYDRALALCRQIGETSSLFACMSGLHSVYMMQREYHKARTHAEQFLRLTENVHDPALLLLGRQMLGISLYPLGELSAARAYFEQGLAWHNPQQPFSASVSCLSHLTTVLWALGYPDQALGRVREALAVAQQLSLPFWVGFALHFTTQLHYRRREERTAQEQAEVVMTLSTEQGFPFWLGWATLFRGGALVTQGQSEIGLRQIHQGLATLRAMGSVMSWSGALAVLAEAYRKVGQSEAGLNGLIEALAIVDKTDERFYEAELYRLKGELTLESSVQRLEASVQGEAEECFLKAIEVAKKQQAKSWELRATMSLVRLRQHQAQNHVSHNTQHEVRNRLDEAHKLLSDVYNWFTEGFDTKDLREARTLLEELR